MKLSVVNYQCCGEYLTPGICPICGQRREQKIDRSALKSIAAKTEISAEIIRAAGIQLEPQIENLILKLAKNLYLPLHCELLGEIQSAVPLELRAELAPEIQIVKNLLETQKSEKIEIPTIDTTEINQILKSLAQNYKLVELEYRNSQSAEIADKLLEIEAAIRAINLINNKNKKTEVKLA